MSLDGLQRILIQWSMGETLRIIEVFEEFYLLEAWCLDGTRSQPKY